MGEQIIKLSKRDCTRLDVLRQVTLGQLTVRQAAEVLEVSERQMFRIVAAYRERRLASLAHGNRGRKPARRLPDEVRAKVVALTRTVYPEASQHRLRLLLAENEGIYISRSTVRNILREAKTTGEEVPLRWPPEYGVAQARNGQLDALTSRSD